MRSLVSWSTDMVMGSNLLIAAQCHKLLASSSYAFLFLRSHCELHFTKLIGKDITRADVGLCAGQ